MLLKSFSKSFIFSIEGKFEAFTSFDGLERGDGWTFLYNPLLVDAVDMTFISG
jgi:hypothetical protein